MMTTLRIGLLTLVATLTGCQPSSPEPPVPVFGTLERDRVELRAHHAERIVSIEAKEGQQVIKDQVILRQDDRSLRAQWAVLNAQKQAAQARLQLLINGPREQELARAEAQLDAATSASEEAKRQLDRVKALADKNLGSESNEDLLKNRYDQSLAALRSAEQTVSELREGSRQEQIEEAAAQVAQIDASIAELSVALDKLIVRAPSDGLLERLPSKLGSDTLPGAVVAIMLTGEQPYARIHVPEPRMAQFSVGQNVSVRADGFEQTFNGRVRYLSAEADFTPWLALNKDDRERLSFVAEIDLVDASAKSLPTGIPLQVTNP